MRKEARRRVSFSPLFIAVGVHPPNPPSPPCQGGTFSPLFIAVGSATSSNAPQSLPVLNFQSAFHRGRECNSRVVVGSINTTLSFSPLFIAVGSVTSFVILVRLFVCYFQSAFHRDMGIIDNSNHFVYCFSQIPLHFPQKSDLRR